jgi:hypothetical protein
MKKNVRRTWLLRRMCQFVHGRKIPKFLSSLTYCMESINDEKVNAHPRVPQSEILASQLERKSRYSIRSHKQRTQELMDSEMSPFDILLGKEKESFNHVGNRNFRSIINSKLESYIAAPTKSSKTKLIRQIHAEMIGLGFRFFRRNDLLMLWEEIEQLEARGKVSHALRDRVRELHKPVMKRRIRGGYCSKTNLINNIPCNNEFLNSPTYICDFISVTAGRNEFKENDKNSNEKIPKRLSSTQDILSGNGVEKETFNLSIETNCSIDFISKQMSQCGSRICHDEFEPIPFNKVHQQTNYEENLQPLAEFEYHRNHLSQLDDCCIFFDINQQSRTRSYNTEASMSSQRRLSVYSLDEKSCDISFCSALSLTDDGLPAISAPQSYSISRGKGDWAMSLRRFSLSNVEQSSYQSLLMPHEGEHGEYGMHMSSIPSASHHEAYDFIDEYNGCHSSSLEPMPISQSSQLLSMKIQDGEYYITFQPENKKEDIPFLAENAYFKSQRRHSLLTIIDEDLSVTTRRFSMCSVESLKR